MSRSAFGAPHDKRRRFAGLLLVLGALVVIATASKDYPREQPIVFRLPDTKSATLVASFTRVGDAEASAGVTLELTDRAFRDVNHTVRLPNGDYIVTIDLRRGSGGAGAKRAAGARPPFLIETSVSKRVTLSGSEVVVPVPARSE